MNFYDLKNYFGSIAAAAAKIGVVRQAVYEWERTGIPDGRQYQIELLTDGDLKADVRPDRSGASTPPETRPAP